MTEHTIVPAQAKGDAVDFVKLFLIAAPEYVPALFAGTHERLLGNCFRYKRNLLGFELAHFVKVNGKNAGMVLTYDWIAKKKQSPKSSLLTIRYMRIKFFTQLRHLQWAEYVLAKIDDGTFYVATLAFYPEFRNQGLGTNLLSYTEEAAKKVGATKLDVDAETYNEDAIRFYKRFGMQEVGEPKGTVIAGKEFEFIRLSKDI